MGRSHSVEGRGLPGDPCRGSGELAFTLPELVLVLLVAGMALSFLLPAARRSRDRLAAVGAREAVVALLVRTRETALTRGGATLRLRTEPPAAWVEAGGEVLDHLDLGDRFGVALEFPGGRRERELRFGALGTGLVASATVRFVRGEARAGLRISSYGRVVREP